MILWMRARADEARVAMMFLTRLPMGRVARTIPIAQTAWAWPIAGAVLGCVFAIIYTGSIALGLIHPVAILLAMAGMLLAGGGLHEDGLADLADGVGGGADPARRLEIMRDSRLGSYGAMALIFAFGIGFALWNNVPPQRVVPVAIAVGMVSRMGLPLASLVFAPARQNGLGFAASRQMSQPRIGVALGLGVVGGVALLPVSLAVGAVVLCLCVQGGICLYARKMLGGVTGDVLGSAQVLGALAVLLILGGR